VTGDPSTARVTTLLPREGQPKANFFRTTKQISEPQGPPFQSVLSSDRGDFFGFMCDKRSGGLNSGFVDAASLDWSIAND